MLREANKEVGVLINDPFSLPTLPHKLLKERERVDGDYDDGLAIPSSSSVFHSSLSASLSTTMSSSKAKSGIFDTSINKTRPATSSGVSDSLKNKTTPATPRASKFSRAGSTKSSSASPSPLQNSRLSIDRSPKSVDSKPSLERRSLRLNTPPDKQSRLSKGSEHQVQLGIVQEELKKAREQLALTELEKARALEESQDYKRLFDEANEKLREVIVAKKRAEESSEIEKFRADELEQTGIETAHKREEWQKELENVQNQHDADIAALVSTTQELEKVKHELATIFSAKNTALSHAEDAMKIAEINSDKVLFLSEEVSRLNVLLDSKMESMSNETVEVVEKLDRQIGTLKHELENAKDAKEKLVQMEELVEGLKSEVTDAKRAETDISKLIDAWKRKAELFEAQLEEATITENTTAEVVKKLESQVDALRQELVRGKAADEKLVQTEVLVERLRTELINAKQAESDACELVEEWKKKAELLEIHVEEASHSKNENIEQVKILNTEVDVLKHKLERAKAAEDKLVEMEALVEELRTELNDEKRTATDAHNLIDDWKRKTELLEVQVEEANRSKKSSLDNLDSVLKQLEDSNSLLQDAGFKIAALNGIIETTEVEKSRHKEDLKESEQRLDVAQQEKLELGKTVKALKSKFQTLQEQKLQTLNNEKVATLNIESMTAERKKLITELEISKDEERKVKKVMEDLASALHEVSTEARETQERLLAKQSESEDAYAQIEELKLTLKNTEERYQVMLNGARDEMVCLRSSIERYEIEYETSRSEWHEKELNFIRSIKKLEEELASLKIEMEKLAFSLKGVEHEAQAAREAETEMVTKLRQAESGLVVANRSVEAANAEIVQLKERLLDKENELQNITQENDDLRIRETATLEKVRELSLSFSEATGRSSKEKGELAGGDHERDLLPNSKEFQENTDENESEKTMPETLGKVDDSFREDTKPKENENQNKEEEPAEVEDRKWPKSEIMDKDSALERKNGAESTGAELDSKIESSRFDQRNGLLSVKIDNGVVQQQKKKNALLHKFGHLLKKKSSQK